MPQRLRTARANKQQPYPREKGSLLARHSLFPRLSPPLPESQVKKAAETAFQECGLTRRGQTRSAPSVPKELVSTTLKHLKERTDPIDGVSIFSSVTAEEVFLDAIFHEMHRHKMLMGDYYHKLILELMKISRFLRKSNVQNAGDGPREGDIIADVRTPGFSKGLRIYASVKKSADTVGGQDFRSGGPSLRERCSGRSRAQEVLSLCFYDRQPNQRDSA